MKNDLGVDAKQRLFWDHWVQGFRYLKKSVPGFLMQDFLQRYGINVNMDVGGKPNRLGDIVSFETLSGLFYKKEIN